MRSSLIFFRSSVVEKTIRKPPATFCYYSSVKDFDWLLLINMINIVTMVTKLAKILKFANIRSAYVTLSSEVVISLYCKLPLITSANQVTNMNAKSIENDAR